MVIEFYRRVFYVWLIYCSEGWEQNGLYEFFRAKMRARRRKGQEKRNRWETLTAAFWCVLFIWKVLGLPCTGAGSSSQCVAGINWVLTCWKFSLICRKYFFHTQVLLGLFAEMLRVCDFNSAKSTSTFLKHLQGVSQEFFCFCLCSGPSRSRSRSKSRGRSSSRSNSRSSKSSGSYSRSRSRSCSRSRSYSRSQSR